MRTVGRREAPVLELAPSGALLKQAAVINDVLSALLPRGRTPVVKGLYHYRTLAEANRHQDEMTAAAMAAAAREHA